MRLRFRYNKYRAKRRRLVNLIAPHLSPKPANLLRTEHLYLKNLYLKNTHAIQVSYSALIETGFKEVRMKTCRQLPEASPPGSCARSAAQIQRSRYRLDPPEDLFFQSVISYLACDNPLPRYVVRNNALHPGINAPRQIAVLYGAKTVPIKTVSVSALGLLHVWVSGESKYNTIMVQEAPLDSDNVASSLCPQLTKTGFEMHYAPILRFNVMNETAVSRPLRAGHPEPVTHRKDL